MGTAVHRLVVFGLDDRRYALHLSAVERVVPSVAITPLPQAPDIVLGILNVQGSIVPVVDTRKRFGLPQQDLGLSDRLILACTSKRLVALVANAVAGVLEHPRAAVTAAERILGSLPYVEGVLRLEDGLVLIHDLDTFLSPLEERTLQRAMPPS